MLAPLSWLKQYVDINIEAVPFADKMTMSGSKVEVVEGLGAGITGVVIGKILSIDPHPNAEKLTIVKVDIGEKTLQIVTGAKNIAVGNYVPVATDGAKLPGGVEILKGELRGEISEGMLCSQEELGISKNVIPEASKDGIWIINEELPLGADAVEVLEAKDEVIEFEITSNRPDCLSMIGMAREAAATIGGQLKYPEISLKECDEAIDPSFKVTIEDQEGCSRYVARVIKDVVIKPSPLWMQARLRKVGIRPINNIVDITNYVMHEYGQPLHAFDMDFIEGNQIIVRKATESSFKTLDAVERKLNDSMTMIADGKKALAIAGVMGGAESEVTAKTTTILLESANFTGEKIRATSKRLALRTEASSKFEKGIDPNLAIVAANRACQLIELLGAGRVLKGAVDAYPVVKEERQFDVRPERVNALLGTEISNEEMIKILATLEIKGEMVEGKIRATIPTFREDLQQEADFVEEVGRIFGFDNIPATMMRGRVAVGGKTNGQMIEEKTKDTLNAMGFNEILTYSFVSPKSVDKIRVAEDSIKRSFVRLLNPLGDETSVMRTSLLPNLLEVLSRNQNRKVEEVRAFEIGSIFIPKAPDVVELPYEISNLVLGLYGEGEDFFTLKGAVEGLLNKLGITNYYFEVEKHHTTFHPGRCANLILNGHILGTIGEIHPLVMENYDVQKKCYCAEMDYSKVVMYTRIDKLYKQLPKYPAITRDFAVVLKDTVFVKELEDIIKENGGDILESYKLFDVYQGNQIAAGHKSIAYTLTYRHKERTLTDEEVSKVHEAIVAEINQRLGGALRE